MSLLMSLKAFLSDRLAAAAEEIFDAVEKTVAEYKEEICRSKDLEISRLRMQLKLLKADAVDRCLSAHHSHHSHHHPPPPPGQQLHQSSPAVELPEAGEVEGVGEEEEEEEGGDGGSGRPEQDEQQPEVSQVKEEEEHKSQRDFWMSQDDDDNMDNLEPDIKDFIASPVSLKVGLHDHALPFHPYHHHHHHHHHLPLHQLHHNNSGGGSITVGATTHHNGSSGDEGKDKPYCCSVCEKRFSNCSHLAAHIRTHTGERPYRCEICRKTFITTSALNRHQTIHTEGKQYVCTFCGKSFKWMESLGRHVRSVHKTQDVSV